MVGNEGKPHDSGISKTVGLKTEATSGYMCIGLHDTACGTVPQSLESLNDLGRKLKIPKLSMNFPENLLSYSIDRKGNR